MADDFDKAIRKLRTVLAAFTLPEFKPGAFRVPGLPSPGFLRRAAEIEQTLQWCEQHPGDPQTAEILRGLLIEAGMQPATPSPNPPADPPPPTADYSPNPPPPPEPEPTRRDRAKRKQAAVQDIARRAFSPKGEVPPNISTARFKRDHVDPTWEVVAPTYGLTDSRPPDWHTVNRAIGREL